MAWAKVLAGILLYDVWRLRHGRATLTREFQEALEHPRRRYLAVVALLYIALHLLGRWPQRADPLHLAANKVRLRGSM